jgi:hypothetical protein
MSCNTVPSVCDIASEYDLANSSSLQDDDISPLSGSVISLALPDSQSDGKERPAQDEARQKATFSTWTIGWRTSLIMFALYLFCKEQQKTLSKHPFNILPQLSWWF